MIAPMTTPAAIAPKTRPPRASASGALRTVAAPMARTRPKDKPLDRTKLMADLVYRAHMAAIMNPMGQRDLKPAPFLQQKSIRCQVIHFAVLPRLSSWYRRPYFRRPGLGHLVEPASALAVLMLASDTRHESRPCRGRQPIEHLRVKDFVP